MTGWRVRSDASAAESYLGAPPVVAILRRVRLTEYVSFVRGLAGTCFMQRSKYGRTTRWGLPCGRLTTIR